MRCPRPIIAVVALALAGTVAGCSSFDPSDMLDFLDTKKKLPGERRPVFPEGVPGIEQGIPRDMMKGAQQNDPVMDTPPAAAPASPPPASPSSARSAAVQQQEIPAVEAPPGHQLPAQKATPPKNTKLTTRRSVTAIPKEEAAPAPQQSQPVQQQPTQSAFPAPLPSSTFQR